MATAPPEANVPRDRAGDGKQAERRHVLDMDVPMPAGPAERAHAAGAPWKTWVEERRRPVIAGAFAAAALLGVLIGLVTAPAGTTSTTDTTDVAAAARSPQLPTATWDATRISGAVQNIQLNAETSPVLRKALTWAAADYALEKAGKPSWSAVYRASGSPGADSATAQGSAAPLTDRSLTIPPLHLYYGVVEGTDDASDTFWAVGKVESASTAVPVAGLQVWKRFGPGPWTVVQTGQGACAVLPPTLIQVWGTPRDCSMTS
jgi:hypothetical protein